MTKVLYMIFDLLIIYFKNQKIINRKYIYLSNNYNLEVIFIKMF